MPTKNRENLERDVRVAEQRFSGQETIPSLTQKIGEDLSIRDDDFYLFIEHLGDAHSVDLLSLLEIRPPRKVKPWSIASFIKAFRYPGLIEDPSLERIVDLLEQSGRRSGVA